MVEGQRNRLALGRSLPRRSKKAHMLFNQFDVGMFELHSCVLFLEEVKTGGYIRAYKELGCVTRSINV